MPTSITEHFEEVTDPRREQGKRHQLLDIITIAICAVICGADNWVEVERYGHAKYDWLKTFLALPHGIPSHDTFNDVFERLNPDEFRASLAGWVQSIVHLLPQEVVAIDGKALRGSKDGTLGRPAIDMVSAWACQAGLVFGQVKTDDHSNEITAIPALLETWILADCIVTIDAMGCQTDLAEQIVDQGGVYILRVKGNQGHLYDNLQDLFAGCEEVGFVDVPHDYHRTINKGHGRIEIRECWTLTDEQYLAYLPQRDDWRDLCTVVKVRRERRSGDQTQDEVGYYISSFAGSAAKHLQAVRHHWHIENCLHWVLDIAFREDAARLRNGHGAQNFAVLRHIALNLLKRETSVKVGIKAKRLQAGWDNRYLLRVLQT
jgi:predicted transposase YbfD/YdcC